MNYPSLFYVVKNIPDINYGIWQGSGVKLCMKQEQFLKIRYKEILECLVLHMCVEKSLLLNRFASILNAIFYHIFHSSSGGTMGCPETMCPRPNFLGPLVPKMNRPRNTMSCNDTSLSLRIKQNPDRLMHNSRKALMQGHCLSGTTNFGDQGSPKTRTGTHRCRTSHHPTIPAI